ncbi:MAG: hypothetical protein ACXVAS_18270 [Vulcanimicrobiaceae bacterium]
MSVHLSKAPVAGHVLVLFFESNKAISSWPATSGWVLDASTSTPTHVMHHVVKSGETGTYTVNVGGSGSGWADYMVAEVSGANTSSPVNTAPAKSIAAGTTSFGFSAYPSAAGTFPIAFLTAHQSGHTWSSISNGWTIADHNADYSEMLASGPVQTGTGMLAGTATLSSASGYAGAADVVALNSASAPVTSPSPTPVPPSAPSPVPSSAPTSAPVSAAAYIYHGVQIYPVNDWFTTDLIAGGSSYAANTVDANSTHILNYVQGLYGNIKWYSPAIEGVNIATNSTPRSVVSGCNYGCKNDPYNDAPSPFSLPGPTSPDIEEGATSGGCTGDCHLITLNPQSGLVWEAYKSGSRNWSGTSINTEGAYVHNLNHPFNDQYSIDGGIITAGGIPNMGTTDWGEEAAGASTCNDDGSGAGCIHHAIAFFLPQPGNATGEYVAPATAGGAAGCKTNCSWVLPMGARIRLHSSFKCPSATTNPQAHLVCVQLKHYGAILNDTQGGNFYGLRFGESTNATSPWSGDGNGGGDLDAILSPTGSNYIHITDFDVMTLGTLHNGGTP